MILFHILQRLTGGFFYYYFDAGSLQALREPLKREPRKSADPLAGGRDLLEVADESAVVRGISNASGRVRIFKWTAA